jgi:F420H(2)-dependent quinone reductase
MYQTDGDRWVVIASNGGNARHPAWWLNLRAQPRAAIQVGGDTHLVTAYALRTTREIPVVLLQRR